MSHVKYRDSLYRASKPKALTITLHVGVHMSTFSLTHTHTHALSLASVCAFFFCTSHVREEGEAKGGREGRMEKRGQKGPSCFRKKEKQEKQI